MDEVRGARVSGWRRIGQGSVVMVVLAAFFASFGATAATAATGNFSIDLTNRESVRQSWYADHEVGIGLDPGWTGSISSCTPGTVTQAYLDATLTRINWYRAMSGVYSGITFTSDNNRQAQAAALMMSAANQLSHTPLADNPSWPCGSADGDAGAGSSNLALGNTGPDAIDQLMKDDGDGNKLGHRRNSLSSNLTTMGSGSVPGTSGHAPAEAQYLGDFGSNPAPRDGFQAWPPPGFVPYQVVFPRWNFDLPGANFSNATVSMSVGGNPVTVSSVDNSGSFGRPGIKWNANGMTDANDHWPQPASDQVVHVTISGITGAAQSTYQYDVKIFDPADPDPAHTALAITGSSTPTVNQANAYSVNAIPNATGYQWRTTHLSSFSLTDDAESGLTNWDGIVNGGSPLVSDQSSVSPTHSFHLNFGADNAHFHEQSITLKKTLVPKSGAQVSFSSRGNFLDGVHATFDVSTDNGSTWTPLFTEAGTSNSEPFATHTASLNAYVNQHVRLRFHVGTTGSSIFVGNDVGWYIDDIGFSNFSAADSPQTSGVSASRNFSFTPTQAGDYDIEVRANFPGSGFGNWSAAKRVTATGGGTATLADALDNSSLTFFNAGNKSWASQTSVTHDGVDAAKSGAIGNNQSSTIVTSVTGPTKLRFWWKSDSKAGDVLSVTVDGTAPFAGIDGSTGWTQKTISIASGSHTVRWTYMKDATGKAGADAGYVDQVTTSSK